MAQSFDPYHAWLGIPAEEQPPNHYRLLGLAMFEASDEAISHAADRQMTYLRQLQAGPHHAESQKLLNEIASARLCLLNPAAKAAYDAWLRGFPTQPMPLSTPHAAPPATVAAQPSKGQPVASAAVRAVPTPNAPASPIDLAPASLSKRIPQKRRPLVRAAGPVVAAILGLVLGWIILGWVRADRADHPLAADNPVSDDPADSADSAAATATPRAEQPTASAQKNDPFQLSDDPADDAGRPRNVSPIGSSDPAASVDENETAPALPATKSPPAEAPVPPDPAVSPAEQLDALKAAQSQFLSEGNLSAALSATRRIADLEEQDSIFAQLAVLRQFQQGASDANALRTISMAALTLLDDALDAAQPDVARQIADVALLAARAGDDPALIRRATLGVLSAR